MMITPYQRTLAEVSLNVSPASDGNGEVWYFYWYMDPLTRGLSESYRFSVHISFDGTISMLGMWIALNEREETAQRQAIQFVKERYQRYGLEEREI